MKKLRFKKLIRITEVQYRQRKQLKWKINITRYRKDGHFKNRRKSFETTQNSIQEINSKRGTYANMATRKFHRLNYTNNNEWERRERNLN